jgi:hypothetical protein
MSTASDVRWVMSEVPVRGSDVAERHMLHRG